MNCLTAYIALEQVALLIEVNYIPSSRTRDSRQLSDRDTGTISLSGV